MSNNIAKEVTIELFHLLDASMDKIRHCLGQLDENQIWWRSFEGQNSIGNHILHMGGNLRQWVCSGIGGGPDNRNREQEFAERGPITTDQLLRQLDQVIADAKTTLSSCTDTSPARTDSRLRRERAWCSNALDHAFCGPHPPNHRDVAFNFERRISICLDSRLGSHPRSDLIRLLLLQ